jgi:hypothetical protein
LIDDLLGQSARILLFPLCEGESPVGLKIAIGGIGHAYLGFEAAIDQTELGGSTTESAIKVTGDGEREGHRSIQELRLALSKKDFCACDRRETDSIFNGLRELI